MGETVDIRDTQYNYGVIRKFAIMTLVWGAIGMLAGVWAALELAWPVLNFDQAWLSFGRLRPVHTNMVIFGMGGSALIGTSFYVVQRTCQVRLAYGKLAEFVFWGWTVGVFLIMISYPLGFTQGKEYAEFEWPIDWAVAIVWVCYFWVFFNTLLRRKQEHIYVANWFYLAFILATALLHIFNNIAIPVFDGFTIKSYNVFAGVQDAMVQWWYGHNAVGFFLTVAFLGMMYYFVPKEVNRPVYSYRLSIIHFWALSFLYMWAGAHHLHWTSLPDWVSSLAATFSIILLLPSWGGMINGIMTLSGAWDQVRTNPIVRFFIVALSFYGMSTFEGPLMSLKSVNALSHYTDWTVGHVHSGALGWVAMITFGSLYHMIPRVFGGRLYSEKLVFAHFWLATIGIVLYVAALWVAGIGQGMMLRGFDPNYGTLTYKFIETVQFMHVPYILRALGGSMFLLGAVIMIYNFYMTIKQGTRAQADKHAAIPAAVAHA
ncbi:cytochrome-c oxidase, cbb3-type subunit I [Wohlfahrtiimonas chitiniclastica]|uniref:cytochrome-c oxidase n=1 Tax=Wohlfahrtiimonas chitiniclastica TaxID=400946 RepID=A0AB35C290_9GAMM|nr:MULTISPECIES: cytochrome-c oxidase, cbb3-type subunit I [Wohlfahrtiimonas]KZX36600.1 cytochrome C oxidase Cbb3 [Wohlfahrtiimonas chitiniclastica]MBS7814480.1 cytochrome-c oxidase, cbb3-type subunit I [Wohlfahrtiimonas chitiniclastica]MBS7816500.1 cytochrome-c oxidase, cbb3-type subunit I [Wohlfahrtiimonas chitiniclastica]MBS7818361.1 cytochrome-c oxidase, cbb3-type subunit I [Wohlfahrtiimonas chitiniclastica]MBS7820371.1 cytochrome-c oxidase, cbb3-type subunit I [Wohlfahrtiimonas chitinicla